MTKFTLTDDETMLQESAKRFLKERAPVSELRKLRDQGDGKGFDPALWQEMTALGWAGMLIPEEFGGIGFSNTGAGLIMREMGRTLTAAPFLSTAVVAAGALLRYGSDEQKGVWPAKIAAGEAVIAPTGNFAGGPGISAKRSGDGWELDGEMHFAPDAGDADVFLVVANDGDGRRLFLLSRDTAGVTVTNHEAIDSHGAASVALENVALGAEAELRAGNAPEGAAEFILDLGAVMLAAHLLGVAEESFERTLEYLRERKQFGVAIGSFQALQHRAAEIFAELTVTESAVLAALRALDEGSDQSSRLASLAKAKAGETALLATGEAIQMHGGIGMTDEFDIGFFLKRARVATELYGNSAYHIDRYARLKGY